MDYKERLSKDQPKEWRDEVKDRALNFAQVTQSNFGTAIQNSMKLIPLKENGAECLSFFVETLLGSTVGLLGSFIGTEVGFEDEVVRNVRERFQYLRDAKTKALLNGGIPNG